MDGYSEITGKITAILFRNEASSFTVAKFRLYELNEKEITITGYLPVFTKDVLYTLSGDYTEHPRFGMQFQVVSTHRVLPTDIDSIVAYLSSPLFQGIGKKFAQACADAFGESTLSILKENPDRVEEITGWTPKKKQALIEGLIEQGDLEEAVRFFTTHGLGIRNIMRLDRAYGNKTLALIKENPYRLIDEVDGIGFATADKLALSMGVDPADPRRISAACVSCVMEQCMRSGNSFVNKDILHHALYRKLSPVDFDFDTVLDDCFIQQKLMHIQDDIFHHTQYESEKTIADFFYDFPQIPLEPYDEGLLETGLEALQNAKGIRYDTTQIDAIHQFFDNPCTILTGGPGTGKTTVVGAMIGLWKFLYPHCSIACAAPTGRAAKRMSELTQADSFTIHSLLRWDLETNTFGKNENEPLALDLIIIDEFSMVDQWLFAQLLKAGVQIKKLLIVGDQDQLPSVAPGCVLKDMIDSQRFPVISLNHIYRQKEGSDVISLAHQMRQGSADFTSLTQDVKWIPCDNIDVKNVVLRVVQDAMQKGYGVQDIQIMAPKYSGNCGIDALNHAMQKMVNPSNAYKRELKVGYVTYREQDKILQLKNQPNDDVYNGDIGTCIEIVYAAEDENHQNRIVVDFDGRIVEYTGENFINITLAYCISVHKAQGSEYPIVLLPCVGEYGHMLQRRLLYTAVTRASKALVLIGDPNSFIRGIATIDVQPRLTYLKQRLLDNQ